MDDVIRVQDQYYILATSSRADERARVLKQGETFAVFDRYGDVVSVGLGEQGLFHEGTRHLSTFRLRIGDLRPLLLSSTVRQANDLFVVDLTNPDIPIEGDTVLPRGSVHLFRARFLWQGVCYERLRVSNHALDPVRLSVELAFDADFADIFEVRGTHRARRGELREPSVEHGAAVLAYQGLDGVLRRTRIDVSPRPAQVDGRTLRLDVALEPQQSETYALTIACEAEGSSGHRISFEHAQAAAAGVAQEARTRSSAVDTANEQFNQWLERSVTDLHMMITDTAHGEYPYAGVPWYSTPFGRDGIVTALEVLWADPSVARGVLAYLAATQASEMDPRRDAEPGKILHETRRGEMAALGEVPFGRYYGTVDATPLFVVLAAAYYERTANLAFIESLWPHLDRALDWLDTYGDPDGDGFVEYARRSPTGLVQQGWKDSHDSVFHADGSLAEGPIALCEVQGYAYAARRGAAELATALGREERARDLLGRAEALRRQFEQRFWSDELGTYALALDGRKRPCLVRASNAGHCLFTGIAGDERGRRVAQTLLDDASFSGWGIRTLAAGEVRYNPMSYHNGSVWPHDNALVAAGLRRYGQTSAAARVLGALFDASRYLDLHRMPELFCGFKRREGEGPTLYPVACAPQAWASAAVFLLLQSCLGMRIDAPRGQVMFEHAALPEFLERVRIRGMAVGRASLDLLLERHANDVGVTVLRREGDVEVMAIK